MITFWLVASLFTLSAVVLPYLGARFFLQRWQPDPTVDQPSAEKMLRQAAPRLLAFLLGLSLCALSGYGLSGYWHDLWMQERIAFGAHLEQPRDAEDSLAIIRYLEGKLEEAPKSLPIWYQLGVEYLKISDVKAALHAFEQALMFGNQAGLEGVLPESLPLVIEYLRQKAEDT